MHSYTLNYEQQSTSKWSFYASSIRWSQSIEQMLMFIEQKSMDAIFFIHYQLSSWLLRFSLVIVGDDDLNYLFNWFAHWYGLDKSIDSIYLVFAPPQWCVVLRKVVSPGIWYELGSCFLKEALDLFIEIVEFVRIKKCLWLSMRTPLFYLIYQFEHFVRTEIYPAVGAKLTQNTRHIISKTYQRGQHSRLPNRQQFNSMNHN